MWAHLKKHPRLKLKLTLWAVFWSNSVYFFTQNFVFFPVVHLVESPIDQKIPFIIESVYVYESLYLFVVLAPLLFVRQKFLISYTQAFSVMVAVCGFIFIFFPTECPRPPAPDSWLYARLIAVDKPLNSFPSMHIAMTVLCATAIDLSIRRFLNTVFFRILLWLFAMAICISTMTLKQHMFIDVAAGAAVGSACVFLMLYLMRRERL